jgi:hypothetical protein
MICPKCEKSNQCPCTNCDTNGDKPNKYIWIDAEHGVVQCCFCGLKFNEQDSLDFEWNKMVERILQDISPELCIEWFETGRKDLNEFPKSDYELAFGKYFNKRPLSLSGDEWIEIKREFNLNKILK